jgi:hypothetical protein
VADRPEGLDRGKVAALVGEEEHSLVSAILRVVGADKDDLFVSDGVRRITYGSVNVFAPKGWIGVQEIGFGSAFAQFPEYQFDRNAGSPDDGFSKHDPRIDFDAIRDCHQTQNTPEACLTRNARLIRSPTVSMVFGIACV